MQTEQIKKVIITEEKFQKMMLKLSQKILFDKRKFDYVVGIENGGLHISEPISKILGIPHVPIKISFYNKENQANVEPIVDFHNHVFDKKDTVLVLDDLLDQGFTTDYFKNNVPCEFSIGVLYWNKHGRHRIIPEYYIEEKFINTWLVFPWEQQ